MSAQTSNRRVQREINLDAEADRVWAALTDSALLEDWLAEDVDIDAERGGELTLRVDGEERNGTVIEAEPERRLAFTWEREGEGESLVEFALEPAVGGGTRLVVVEQALNGPVALATTGWEARLKRLELVLGRVLVFA
jgi:uncharacterized protein YndB with AHSA1/START domain